MPFQRTFSIFAVSLFLVVFLWPGIVFSESAKLKFGSLCEKNEQCISGDCENADDGKAYCDCDDDNDCANPFEEIGTQQGEKWKCVDEGKNDLDFCESNLRTVYPQGNKGNASNWQILTDSTLGGDEIKKLTSKPNTKITIPGLTFSKPQVVQNESGVYLSISSLGEFIKAAYRYGIAAAGIFAVVIIINAGFLWTRSAGNAQVITQQKEAIEKAVIGLVIAVSSYSLLYFINPNLTKFESLKVQYVKTLSLEDSLDSANNDSDELIFNYTGGGGVSGNCNSYDALFQKYASCLGTDWKVLKAIASVESGCNPQAKNSAGFVGMGQTKPQYCKSIFTANKYSKWESYCTEQALMTPQVGIAVIALLQKNAAKLIKKHCANASPSQQGAMFHAYNNVPAAARRMIEGGCTNPQDFVGYFNPAMKRKEGYFKTQVYLQKYGDLKNNESAYLRAIGTAKLKYAVEKAGPAFASLGGNVNSPAPSGPCPLDTETPF